MFGKDNSSRECSEGCICANSQSGDHVRPFLSLPRGWGHPSCIIPTPANISAPKWVSVTINHSDSCFPSRAHSIPIGIGFPDSFPIYLASQTRPFPAPSHLCIAQGFFRGSAGYIPIFSSSSRGSRGGLTCRCVRRTGCGCRGAGVRRFRGSCSVRCSNAEGLQGDVQPGSRGPSHPSVFGGARPWPGPFPAVPCCSPELRGEKHRETVIYIVL